MITSFSWNADGTLKPSSSRKGAVDDSTPMIKPPAAAPPTLPMPPRTAAVNAVIPGTNPIVGRTDENVSPQSTPAIPASTPPITNVITIVRSTSIPMSAAISRSSETARIDRPVRLRATNSDSATTLMTPMPIVSSCVFSIVAPKISTVPSIAVGTKYPRFWGPKNPWNEFWRNREAPIAVISGTSRGAFRSGR